MAQCVHAQVLDVEPLDDPSVVQALANEYLLAQQRLLPLDSDSDVARTAIDSDELNGDELDLLLELEPPSDEFAESAADISTTTGKGTVNSDKFQQSQQQGAHGDVEVTLLAPDSDGGDYGGDQHGDSTLHPHRSAIDNNHAPSLPVNAATNSSSCFEDEDAASRTEDSHAEQQTAVVKAHPRRNRKRRKHEVDALRIEEKELTEKLKQLQAQMQQNIRMSPQQHGGQLTVQLRLPLKDDDCLNTLSRVQLSMLKKNKSPSQDLSSSSGIWESLAWFQREEVRASMEENTRLRAFYRDQLLMLKHLETMAPDQFPPRNDVMTPAWLQEQLHVGGASALSTKRARVDPFDDDFAIFASLGRDFDAQYAKTDSILESLGLTNFDGRRREEMVPKRGANGIYFLESVFSKKIPRDVHAHDETIWHVLANEQLHAHHGAYEVRELTHDVVLRKIVNKIQMPHEETTLIRRTALKRYIEEDRVVVVWDSVLEVTGSISMRLRERGWKVLRRPHVYPVNHDGVNPLSVEQLCVRITPEHCSTYAEQDIAAGSLTNVIVSSYRRHLMMMHHLDKDTFAVHFKKAVETLMSRLNS